MLGPHRRPVISGAACNGIAPMHYNSRTCTRPGTAASAARSRRSTESLAPGAANRYLAPDRPITVSAVLPVYSKYAT